MVNTRSASRGDGQNHQGNNDQGNGGNVGSLQARQMRRFIKDGAALAFVRENVTEHAKTELENLATLEALKLSEELNPYPHEWLKKRSFEAAWEALLREYLQLKDKGKEVASGNSNGGGPNTSSPTPDARGTPNTDTSAASMRNSPDITTP
jgi:hypothetical protein